MTALDLDAIKARAEAAIAGPWRYNADGGVETYALEPVVYDMFQPERDGPFIAAARSDIPALVAEVERLARWKAEAIAVIAAWEKIHDALGFPGELGQTKSEAAVAEVERLRAENEALTQDCDCEHLPDGTCLAPQRDTERDSLVAEVERFRAECDALTARIEEALALHSKAVYGRCRECWPERWPCPTVAALSPQEGT